MSEYRPIPMPPPATTLPSAMPGVGAGIVYGPDGRAYYLAPQPQPVVVPDGQAAPIVVHTVPAAPAPPLPAARHGLDPAAQRLIGGGALLAGGGVFLAVAPLDKLTHALDAGAKLVLAAAALAVAVWLIRAGASRRRQPDVNVTVNTTITNTNTVKATARAGRRKG